MFAGEAEPHGARARLGPGARAELQQDRGDVVVDRALRQHELPRDLGIPQPLGDEPQHLKLTGGEAGRVRASRRTRPTRQTALAALAQPARDDRSRRPGAERAQRVVRSPQRHRVAGVAEGERRLVGAADALPKLGCPCPVSRQVNRERLRDLCGDGLVDAGAPAPEGPLLGLLSPAAK